MAFTRNEVRRILGDAHTDEIENQLIALHLGVVDVKNDEITALKAERDKYKADADKLPGVQKELDSLKGGEDWKAKYEAEHKEHEDYKKQVARSEELAKIKAAYRKLLTDEHISEKRLDAVIRLTDFSAMKLDKDGNLENADALRQTISNEWGEYKVQTQERKQTVANPPKKSTGSGMSRAKELAQKYAQERYGVKTDTGKE